MSIKKADLADGFLVSKRKKSRKRKYRSRLLNFICGLRLLINSAQHQPERFWKATRIASYYFVRKNQKDKSCFLLKNSH
jgi:hypothetical protein